MLFFCATIEGYAQTYQVNSPYSSIGIGNQQPNYFALNRALGGFSTAYRSIININPNNPASYSAIKLTTFETGIYANGLWLNDGENSLRSGTASLGYLAFGFPVAKFWGFSAGLVPYASNNYDLSVSTNLSDDIGRNDFRFIGTGQLHQFYIGNGFRYKDLSFGFNLGYLFGNYERQTISYFPDLTESFGTQKIESLSAGDFTWSMGLQYNINLKNDRFIILGINGNLGGDAKFDQDSNWYRGLAAVDDFNIADTLNLSSITAGNVHLPTSFSIGAMTGASDWLFGADVTMTNWDSFKYFEEADSNLVTSTRLSAGVSFIPEPRAFNGFWKKTDYRFGFYFDTGHLKINDNRISEFAVTAGLGIPFKRISSKLNLSVAVGQRGKISDGLIRENFVNTTIGITLNDKWFNKRRIE